MAVWTCPVPGCDKEFSSQAAVSGHVGKVHKGWSYKGAAEEALEENTAYSDPPEVPIIPQNDPIDIMHNLRIILANNGVARQREAIIELFREYPPDDMEGLERILDNAGIPVNKKELIMETWGRKMRVIPRSSGYVVPSARQEPKPVNPLTMTPADIMDNPAKMMEWATAMQKYAMTQQMMMQMMQNIMPGMSMNPMGQMKPADGHATLPPEVQAQLNELREMKEQSRQRDAMREFLKPMVEEIKDIRRVVDGRSDGNGAKAPKTLMDYIAEIKMLEALGDNGRQAADQLRMQMEEKMELARMERDKEMRQFDVQKENLRNQLSQAQIDGIKASFVSQVERLQDMLREKETKGSRETIMSAIKEAQEMKQVIDQLGGAKSAEEDKKMEMYSEIIKAAAQVIAPVGQMLMQGVNGQPPRGPMPPVARPSPPRPSAPAPPPADGSGETWQFKCPKEGCGAEQTVVGTPDTLVCPACRSEFRNREAPAPSSMMGAGGALGSETPMSIMGQADSGLKGMFPPTLGGEVPHDVVEARKAELMEYPQDSLEAIARQMGYDPSRYPTKDMLVEEIVRSRYVG